MNTIPLRVLDVAKLPIQIQKLIEAGEYVVSPTGGVVRDLNGKIIQHIPIKEMQCKHSDLQNLPSMLKSAHGTTMAATVLSTTVILGAIVVATTLIMNKMDQIQSSINKIKKELQDQNIFQYFLQLKDYVAASESLREILAHTECIQENSDLIVMKLNEIGIKRNGLLLTLNERLGTIDTVSPEHKEVILNFIDQSIALLPKIAYIETEGANAVGRFYLADRVQQEFSNKYRAIEFRYKRFLNNEIKKSLNGESVLSSHTINNIKKHAQLEFEVNEYLLKDEKPLLNV